MSFQYLTLWLEAPLQSWGYDSKFGRRDTLQFPTKSGVYGIYLAALGARGKQIELLERLSDIDMTIIAYMKKGRKTPFLMDFQMVGSGYGSDKEHPWERLMIPKTADGKKAVGGGSKMTYRYYLQDSVFSVIQKLPSDISNRIVSALQNPVFNLYLGRKNCVPNEFIYQGLFDTEEKAIEKAQEIASNKSLIEDFRVSEGAHDRHDMIIKDVPVQFGDSKEYKERYVKIEKNEKGE